MAFSSPSNTTSFVAGSDQSQSTEANSCIQSSPATDGGAIRSDQPEEKMDFELRRARERLEKEQRDRKDRAKAKAERDRRAKEESRKIRDAIESVQRSRRIDAMEAREKAEQQMQESLLAGKGVAFYRLLEAIPYQGAGDKIKLPPSTFTELSDEGAFDKGPVYFRLSAAQPEDPSDMNVDGNERTTHSGVLEFTADEGCVALPPHVWSNLFGSDSHAAEMTRLVEVRYISLPKGTYAKLQPTGVGFSDLPNHKAILETSLRQHATLSKGDIFTVSYGELTYKLQVLELKPSSTVSVLETDIEVDIISPDSVSEGSNLPVLVPLKFGTSESGVIEEGHYVYYKFIIDEDVWKIIASEDARVEVKVEPDTSDGDTDLYLSRHPLIFPTRHQHGWSSHDVGLKALILSSRDENLGAGAYSIGVYGFKGTTKFQVSLAVVDNVKRTTVGQQTASSSSSIEADTVECRNCKRYIPSRTIALHEAYCSRHNVVCQHAGCGIVLRVEEAKDHVHCERCGQAFHGGEMDKHMKVYHEPISCPCGVVLEKEQMVEHQNSVCPLRLISCRFCGDMVHAGNSAMDMRDKLRGLSEHESICGSRTAPCDSCGRSVMLKDMDIHQIAVHQKN